MKNSLRNRSRAGFTLVEMLVCVAVLAVLMVILTQLIGAMRGTITRTTNEIQPFRQARVAFETMTRRIAQATLNAYDDANPNNYVPGTIPLSNTTSSYVRASELRFITGYGSSLVTGSSPHPTHAIFFQAPLGYTNQTTNPNYTNLIHLLNTCGYYIEWNSDEKLRPSFLPATIPLRWRFRLMEMIQPTENLSIYSDTSGQGQPYQYGSGQTGYISKSWAYNGKDWFQDAFAANPLPVHVLAENVILLALLPMVAPQDAQDPVGGAQDGTSTDLTTNYLYNTAPTDTSRVAGNPNDQYYSINQLPPMIWVLMIAVDEKSFSRFQVTRGSTYPTEFGLDSILTNASYATRTSDLEQVTTALKNYHILYRIFSTAVPLTSN